MSGKSLATEASADALAIADFDLGRDADLAKFCAEAFELQLKHPVSEALLPCFIYLLGSEAEPVQEHIHEQVNEKFRKDARKTKPAIPTVEKSIAKRVETVTAAIWASGRPWKGIKVDGEEQAFTVPNIKKVLTRFPWILNQCDEASGTLENFMPD